MAVPDGNVLALIRISCDFRAQLEGTGSRSEIWNLKLCSEKNTHSHFLSHLHE